MVHHCLQALLLGSWHALREVLSIFLQRGSNLNLTRKMLGFVVSFVLLHLKHKSCVSFGTIQVVTLKS